MAYKEFLFDNACGKVDKRLNQHLLNKIANWEKALIFQASRQGRGNRLSPGDLEKLLEQNHEVMRAAMPVMSEYKEYCLKEQARLILFTLDGIILHSSGVLEKNSDFQAGTILAESCEVESGGEWKCFIEPLLGGRHRIIGFMGLVLPRSGSLNAMSALLHAIAGNISDQHHVQDLLSDQSTMLDQLSDGIIILDKGGNIKAANAQARRILGIAGEKNIALGSISDFVKKGEPFMRILNRKQKVMDEEITFYVGDLQKRYILTTSIIPEDKGVVCALAETARMHKLATRIAGSKAIYKFSDIIGEANSIINAVQLGEVAAQSNITTLLLGESGTGKELFAHAIHNASSRKNGPFVVVNCGALPHDLVQSELFGYEAGAFTGASRNGKPGKFELANGGTIFLDEIGEMPMDAQTNLLRLIQNKDVGRIGGAATKSVDVRIVAATNRNLSEAVARGAFRSDLFYRLSVLVINIPALRSRPSDIPALASHFLLKYASALNRPITGFSAEALATLRHYAWPGNIRELENTIERAVNLAKHTLITNEDLPESMLEAREEPHSEQTAPCGEYKGSNLYQREYQTIIDTLTHCNGNIRLTAQELGIARSALYAKMARYGIDYAKFRHKYR